MAKGTDKTSKSNLKYLNLLVIFLQTVGRLTYYPFLIMVKTVFDFFSSLKKIKIPQVKPPQIKIKKPLLLLVPKIKLKLPKFNKNLIKIKKLIRKRVEKKKRKVIFKSKGTEKKKIGKKVSLLWVKKLVPLLFVFIILSSTMSGFYFWILKDLPSADDLNTQQAPLTTKLYDRNGKLLYKIYRDQNRTLVPLEKIPPDFINATVAIEDKRFFEHNGFSWEGFLRALKRNLLNKQVEGGSTITQQLIKNTLLTSEKTLKRKIKELILSFQTELIFDKKEILTMYLNTVPYGGTAYGVEEAAQTYFNKSVSKLDLAESALLAGLPAAPSKYSPFGSNPELSIIRQHEVLRRMTEDDYITPFEAEGAKSKKVYLAPLKDNILAPHFVMYLKDRLSDSFGLRTVEQGGLTVVSSLNLKIQKMAQEAVQEELKKLKNMNVNNGAALVIKPETGEILAMVGSKNYFDTSIDGNVNIALQERQPGSTIKVINYAYALSHGYTPVSIISDTPISYHIPGQASYQPVNYDHRFHGNVTLRQALASSYNIPAVKVLASFGVDKMISLAKDMGITTWNHPERFGLSLTLGGGEIKMIDLAQVYSVLANQGKKTKLNPILIVKDFNKKALDKNYCFQGFVAKPGPLACLAKEPGMQSECQQEEVLKPEVSFLLSSILSDNNARAPAFGINSLLNIKNHQVAVKTGTTNDKRDNWCIGYTNDYLVAVWVGNNDNQPMSAVASGITGATPIWNKIMTSLLENEVPSLFLEPSGIKKVAICPLNGLKACDGCPNKDEYFLSGTEPKYHCSSEEIKAIREQKEKERGNKILQGLSTSN